MASTEVGPSYAPEDPTLPKPWTGLIDGNTGALYYWNPETNVTQYEKPTALPPPSAAGPMSASTPSLAPIPAAQSQTPSNTMPQHEFGQQMHHQQPPSAAGPQSASTPMLAPIPAARSQTPNNSMPQHEFGQQMHQQQPFMQMHNYQPQHMPNQQTPHVSNQQSQYPPMQMNHMVRSEPPRSNEPPMTQYQGHQPQGPPDNYQVQQNGFPMERDPNNYQVQSNGYPMERDPRRQAVDPAGFSAPPFAHTGVSSADTRFPGTAPYGASADTRYPAPVPHVPPTAEYSVRSDHQIVRHPSSGNQNAGGAFGELPQVGLEAIHRQQPPGGPAVANQIGHGTGQPHMGQKMGYPEDQHQHQHGRERNEYYSTSSNEGPMMPQQQPKFANIPHPGNRQHGVGMGAISQPFAPGHSGGLNVAPEIAMPKIHPMGQSPRMFNSSEFTNSSSVDLYLQKHEITTTGGAVPDPFMSFEATGFPPEILREIHSAGFSAPTPIQAQTWPIALQSRDIVAVAKTGSGKTLGYLVPAFLHLRQCRNNPQVGPTVLVLSPTRELASQIQDEAIKFGRSSRISCTCLYGGAPKGPQLREIERGVDIVVATPGRLNDILEMRMINFSQVSFLVLDEADRMLDMGFEPQIRKIVSEIPPSRQTLMYTATWPKEVRKIAEDLLVKPVQVNIGSVDLSANTSITQYVEVVSLMERQRRLEQIIRTQERGAKIVIFCSTKRLCDQLSRNMRGYGAAAIHGDKSQGERDYVLNQFRSGKAPILVATDVAARGLDIKDIRVVINYDFPTGIEDYVHRIGRTGRAGATGIAYTFISDQDWKHAADLVKILEGASQPVPPQLRDMAARGSSSFSRGRSGGSSRWDSGGGRGTRDDGANDGGRWDGRGRGMGDYNSGRGMRDGGGFGGRGGRSDFPMGGRGGRSDFPGGGRGGRSDFPSGGRGGRSDFPGGGRGGIRGRGFDRGPPGGRGWQDRGMSGRGRYDGQRRMPDRRRDRSYSRSPDRVRTWGYSSDDSRSRSRSRSWSRSRSRSRSWSRSRSRSRSAERPQRARRPSGFDVPLSAPALPEAVPGNDPSVQRDDVPQEQLLPPASIVPGAAEPAADPESL